MISILILTYKQPVALELCLESIVKNQHYKNQILIVENGYCEENKPVFKEDFDDENGYLDENKVKDFWCKDHFLLNVSPDNPLYHYLLYSPKID